MTSSPTGEYVAAPEPLVQNEEPAGSNEERTRKKRSILPKVTLNDAIIFQKCNHGFSLFYFILLYLLLMNFIKVSFEGKNFDLFVYTKIQCVATETSTLISIVYD